MQYLSVKLRERGSAINGAALELLLDLTGGHPDDTVRVANEAFSLAQALGRSTVDMDTVQGAVDRTQEWLSSGFYAQLNEAGRSGVAREVLRDLAHGASPYGAGRRPAGVRRVVDRLIDLAIIERVDRGRYRFVEPLFQRYLRQVLG